MEEAISLKDYLNQIAQIVADNVPPAVWVRAEISELNINRNGHCYITLIEKDPSQKTGFSAKTNAVIWSNKVQLVLQAFYSVTGMHLGPGMKVLVNVRAVFSEAWGFSLYINDIDASYTLGDLARKRQETINQLKADGIWDMNHDLEFPYLPQRVALISSATAAGFGDFINQLLRNSRQLRFDVKLFPAIMQGDNAPASIMNALDKIYSQQDKFDVVAIVRGGGAVSDMLAFDDYELAASCAQFPLPVITGIGHDRDECVLDLIANTHLKTPTAVAAFLVDQLSTRADELDALSSDLIADVRDELTEENTHLHDIAAGLSKFIPLTLMAAQHHIEKCSVALKSLVDAELNKETVRLNDASNKIKTATTQLTSDKLSSLSMLQLRLSAAVNKLISDQQNKMLLNEQKLNLLSPENLLRKGYTLTLRNGKTVRSVNDLNAGDELQTVFADGSCISIVKDKK